MKITVLCVGRIKEKYFTDAVKEYAKRLGRYCKLEILEVMDEKIPDGTGKALEDAVKQKEGEKLLSRLREGAYVIALELEGKKLDSMAFSERLEKLGVHGVSHIVFIIGGSLGLSEEVKKRADEAISFSDMTFPHQLMRVILLEQIYRGYRIINREPYHK